MVKVKMVNKLHYGSNGSNGSNSTTLQVAGAALYVLPQL